MKTKIDNFHAVAICEGFEEAADDGEVIECWQHLIDTGLAWNLQGFFGRNAAALIEAGLCRRAGEVTQ
jgi:hypothetical protein